MLVLTFYMMWLHIKAKRPLLQLTFVSFVLLLLAEIIRILYYAIGTTSFATNFAFSTRKICFSNPHFQISILPNKNRSEPNTIHFHSSNRRNALHFSSDFSGNGLWFNSVFLVGVAGMQMISKFCIFANFAHSKKKNSFFRRGFDKTLQIRWTQKILSDYSRDLFYLFAFVDCCRLVEEFRKSHTGLLSVQCNFTCNHYFSVGIHIGDWNQNAEFFEKHARCSRLF